jgi:quinohemoprotein ethanol dehydrogenase
MMRHRHSVLCFARVLVAVLAGALASFCPRHASAADVGRSDSYAAVDTQRLRHADEEPGQWMTGGRDFRAAFYSPLKQINVSNVGRLGFAWEFKTGTFRGLEATPLMVDGVMYASGNWGVVYALDAKSGQELWRFDPQNDGQVGRNGSTDAVSRGLGLWKGRIYAISMDCRLFALDAKTGQQIFTVDTLVDHKQPYACTGEPRVAGEVVVVGNGGGDNGKGGVRGYVSAYDVESGALKWRFYTVPALNDSNPSPDMIVAARTWDPKRDPTFGGGGTVWNTLTYDPDLDLIYFGTGNAAPYIAAHDWKTHSTDNLYAASIVALHARSGRMAWYYQTTPGDMWDFDAAAPIVLADLKIDNRSRKTLLQANKNGYFYVLDRETGKPISATPFSYLNWSKGMDANFRPKVAKEADYSQTPKPIYPSMNGAHDWEPMSYSPLTGLVYISGSEAPNIVINLTTQRGGSVRYVDGATGATTIVPDQFYNPADVEPLFGPVPRVPKVSPETGKPIVRGVLKAWDPLKKRIVWEQQTTEGFLILEGGTLSTGGGLVFSGRADGQLVAYAADTGKRLKSWDTGTAIGSAPMTYTVDGTQYVSVMEGFGIGASFAGTAALKYQNEGRILTFKLGGGEVPKPSLRLAQPLHKPPAQTGTPEQIAAGGALFTTWCSRCHFLGVPAATPDLSRLEGIESLDVFKSIVLGGAFVPAGMARFNDVLSAADVDSIHVYLIDQSWANYKRESGAAAK